MERRTLVLDIETVPDRTLHEPALDAEGKAAFAPLHAHRVVAIGMMLLDLSDAPNAAAPRLGVVNASADPTGTDEAGMLRAFAAFVRDHRPTLVTFNGRGFDLPVLMLRSLRHGVPMAWHFESAFRHRYSGRSHVDLCDELSDRGAARRASLDELVRLVGLPGKLGLDGSRVDELFAAGRIDDIRDYCLSDVAQTALLYLRFRLLTGEVDLEGYRGQADAVLAALEAEAGLAELAGAVDRAALRLEADPEP